MTDGIGKAEGFRDETYLIVPTESFTEYMAHPLIRAAYLTDVGFFPRAREHYREREEGADQYILIYCTEGKGDHRGGGAQIPPGSVRRFLHSPV